MRGAMSPLSQYDFMAWCLIKHRDTFDLYNFCGPDAEVIFSRPFHDQCDVEGMPVQ